MPAYFNDDLHTLIYKFSQAAGQAQSGPTDPLAGIPFALRLQTHFGDNQPFGLYQDVLCTIPSTQDGDPVAAWRDELSSSGVTLTQSNTMQQPTLRFVGGVPVVEADGVDDFYDTGVSDADPTEIISLAKSIRNDSTNPRFFGTSPGRSVGDFGQDTHWDFYEATSAFPFPQVGDYAASWGIADILFNGSNSKGFSGGVQVSSFTPIVTSGANIQLFANGFGAEPIQAQAVSLFIIHRELSTEERAKINAYLQTLKP